MKRFTTPTHKFTFKDASLIKKLNIVYEQNKSVVLTKHLSDLSFDENVGSYTLTQEETALFSEGSPVFVQLHALFTDGKAAQSNIFTVNVNRVIDDEVIS